MQDFSTYCNQAWNDHAENSSKVASEFTFGIQLISSQEELIQMANLITHVAGEHLAIWDKGLEFLATLRRNAYFSKESPAEKAILKSMAVLKIGKDFSSVSEIKIFSMSDQVAILALSAAAFVDRDLSKTEDLMNQAFVAANQLENNDPANRSLAITNNNLATALESKANLSPSEISLMIKSANAARKFWELAGTWMQVERAEYRLAKVYLKADLNQKALNAAGNCLEISLQNNAPLLEIFFAQEVLCLSCRANGLINEAAQALGEAEKAYNEMPDTDKKWCSQSLYQLR